MMRTTFITALIALLSLFLNTAFGKVFIYKQWHFLPSINTKMEAKPERFPQFENQFDIYSKLKKMVEKKGRLVLLVEGCEGEIKNPYDKKFNGWDLNELSKNKNNSEKFDRIMTHVGLKMEALYPEKVKTICGDNLKLVEKNQLLFSDLRAYIGYYSRLKEFKSKDPKKYELYASTMLKGKKVDNPIAYAKDKAQKIISEIKEVLAQRNDSFLAKLSEYKKDNVAIVIGGLHVDDLSRKIKEKKIARKVITPKGYPKQDVELIKELEKALN